MIEVSCPKGRASEFGQCLGDECPLHRLMDEWCGSAYRGWETFPLLDVLMKLAKAVQK